MTNHGKLKKYPLIYIFLKNLDFYCNIFLSQYFVKKCLVWRGPKQSPPNKDKTILVLNQPLHNNRVSTTTNCHLKLVQNEEKYV